MKKFFSILVLFLFCSTWNSQAQVQTFKAPPKFLNLTNQNANQKILSVNPSSNVLEWVNKDSIYNKNNEIYGVVRYSNTTGAWFFIDDLNHQPSENLDGITTSPSVGYNFGLQHSNNYSKVGSFLAVPDERFANIGFTIGGSVGLTGSQFKICRNGFSVRIVGSANSLSFANDTGQIVKNTDFAFTFDTVTGLLTIEHPTIVCTYGDMGILTMQDPCPYIARFVSRTPTSTSFKLYNNGILVTALSSTFKAYYTKLGTFTCSNEHIGASNGNFWLRGIFKK